MATPRICSIPDCDKPVERRDWCVRHYRRWLRHGNPLAGKAFAGSAVRYFQETVLTYEGDECLPWPYTKNAEGYGVFYPKGRTQKLVSRFLCEIVNGAPPTPHHEAAHSCGNGNLGCVAKRHLSWKTPAENQADRLVHGTSNRGERQWLAKLTVEDVHQIKRLKGTMPQSKIASQFGVTRETINSIYCGRSWTWLP